ncbi:MAG: LdpA C-terminal domain-containing domain [Leptolyngbya sp.]|nr:LdpA C-terminal domain-containing domain [Leptolyngbya sp.]
MIAPPPPLTALKEGRWFKLICGASYQHLPAIRSLALAYALAGADCIDIAADPSVLAAVQAALTVADRLAPEFFIPSPQQPRYHRPWVMVSLNDGEDPHFRKAEFDPAHCPADCPRPCEAICPAEAIALGGVIDSRCYGCGRCFPVCPLQLITPRAFSTSPAGVAAQLLPQVDAVELHTQVGHGDAFARLWQSIRPHLHGLKLLAISCPSAPGAVAYLWDLYRLMGPLPIPLIWQADGRPMSGDIGAGTTHAALRYGQELLAAGPPGFVQLAGGTNHHTALKLRQADWAISLGSSPYSPRDRDRPAPPTPHFGGVAYGSYARRCLAPTLAQLTAIALASEGKAEPPLEQIPDLLYAAVHVARGLVSPLKGLEPRIKAGSAPAPLQSVASRAPTLTGGPPGPLSDRFE